MSEQRKEIGDTSKVGIKSLNEYCKEKHLSIIYNKKNQICGFRKNDYPKDVKAVDKPQINIRDIFLFENNEDQTD